MTKRFYSISGDEMRNFMEKHGFTLLDLQDSTREMVYGKILRIDDYRQIVDSHGKLIEEQLTNTIVLSTRVFTAIEPSSIGGGYSRDSGKDAIRVQNFWKLDGIPRPVGSPVKCLRVASWASNLEKAIEKARNVELFRVCKCGSPMILRNNNNNKTQFWGCAAFTYTKCRNSVVA